MVTPELASWKPAIQACWAASWALEPAPAMSPERSPPLEAALLLELSSELSPQAATPSASRPADAATAKNLRGNTEGVSLSEWDGSRLAGGAGRSPQRVSRPARPASQRGGPSLLRACTRPVKRL